MSAEESDGPTSGGSGRDAKLSRRPRWELALRGLTVLIAGVVVLVFPDLTAGELLTVFGSMLFVEGIFHLVGGLNAKALNPQWPVMFMGGAFSLSLGMFVLGWWDGLDLDLLIAIAYWGVVLGAVHVVFAAKAGLGSKSALLFVAGIVGVGFGLYLLLIWEGMAMDLLTEIGVAFLVIGVLLAALGGSSEGLEA